MRGQISSQARHTSSTLDRHPPRLCVDILFLMLYTMDNALVITSAERTSNTFEVLGDWVQNGIP